MLNPSTLKLLKDLGKNNNREWFEKNRPRVEEAKTDFEGFIAKLIETMAKNDKRLAGLQPKDCIYRIYRDVRFSKNKDPYKTHFAASVNEGGRKSGKAGIYIHIEPSGGGKSFVAGGRWMPEAPILKAIRQEIQYHLTDFKKIINNKTFIKYYGGLENEKLKTIPKGYDKHDPDIELYKYTSFIASHYIPDSELTKSSLVKTCSNAHKALIPLLDFLNKAAD